MAKVSLGAVKTRVGAITADIKKYWHKPRPGEFVSNRQFMYLGLSGLFTDLWWAGPGILGGFGMSWFTGSMMGIAMKDFIAVDMIGMVLGYVFIFMNPVNMLIFENHGKIEKKERILMHSVTLAKMAAGIALYFFPSNFQESFLRGFPYILGNALFLGGVQDYIHWFVRWRFSEKYGRQKPFIILFAVPAVLIGSIMPWFNFASYDYAVKIALLHGSFQLMGFFSGGLMGNGGMVNYMTQNGQERQRLISYIPIFKGVLSSLLDIVRPILITQVTMFGHKLMGFEDIWVYRIMCPLFGVLVLIGALFILPVKENLVEQKINRPKVKFFRGAKEVLKNKYWWITNVSGFLADFNIIMGSFMSFWMVYQRRQTWMSGLVGGLMIFGGTIGSFFVPSVTKRFDKVKFFKFGKIYSIGITIIQMLLFKGDLFWPYVIFTFISGPIRGVCDGAGSGFGADILDYHQWKTGERADAMQGIFGLFFNPANTLRRYIGPYFYVLLGFTSDWAIFHDTAVFNKVFNYTYILAIMTAVLSALPYLLFYDLTTKKHSGYIEEIKERVRVKDVAEIMQHKEAGTLREIDPALLEKYGYDAQGNLIPEESEEEVPAEQEAVLS